MSLVEKKEVKEQGSEGGSGQSNTGTSPQGRGQASGEAFESPKIPLNLARARRFTAIEQEILKLANEPLTFQSIFDRKILYRIILIENVDRILTEAHLRWEKWYLKRGKELPDGSQKAFQDWWRIRATIDTLWQCVCDAYGLTGAMRLPVLRFMMRLYKRLKDKRVNQWLGIVERELKKAELDPDIDPRVLKVAAHLMLKLMSDIMSF
jgi:hypothetical protein